MKQLVQMRRREKAQARESKPGAPHLSSFGTVLKELREVLQFCRLNLPCSVSISVWNSVAAQSVIPDGLSGP